jgi:hypothetical protein
LPELYADTAASKTVAFFDAYAGFLEEHDDLICRAIRRRLR